MENSSKQLCFKNMQNIIFEQRSISANLYVFLHANAACFNFYFVYVFSNITPRRTNQVNALRFPRRLVCNNIMFSKVIDIVGQVDGCNLFEFNCS